MRATWRNFTKYQPRYNLKEISGNIEYFEKNVKLRGMSGLVNINRVVELYKNYNTFMIDVKKMRSERNRLSDEIVKTKDPVLIRQAKELKVKISEMELQSELLEEELSVEAGKLPNTSWEGVPSTETVIFQTNNVDLEKKAMDHLDVCTQLDLCDFESASEISGSKWYYLKNKAVLLELALVRFVSTFLIENGWTIHTTPELVRRSVVEACGFQPRGNHTQIYSIQDSDLCLIGTSEIPLAALQKDKLISNSKLPIRVAGISHCYRTEAGAAGLKDKGLYRVHQFQKVEMFAFTRQEDSNEEFLRIIELQKKLYSLLEIPFRAVEMPPHELGASAHRKIDIEAWMPGKGIWGEISSTSNCTDYQSRRLNIRYQMSDNLFVHTLNGTGLAVPRILIAILENNQYRDTSGSLRIRLPKCLDMTDL